MDNKDQEIKGLQDECDGLRDEIINMRKQIIAHLYVVRGLTESLIEEIRNGK